MKTVSKWSLCCVVMGMVAFVIGTNPSVCLGAGTTANPYSDEKVADAHPGIYDASVSAPDSLTTNGDVKVTGAVAAPMNPADAGKVVWTNQGTNGATAIFEGRSTNWGCFYSVTGVFVGSSPSGSGSGPNVWYSAFSNSSDAHILLYVNDIYTADDDYIPYGGDGTLSVMIAGGSSETLYTVSLSADPSGKFVFSTTSVTISGGGSATVNLHGQAAGSATITGTCTSTNPSGSTAASANVEATVFKVTLKDITFTTASPYFYDNNSDWSDNGNAFDCPQWTPQKSCPILCACKKNIGINVSLEVEPASVPAVPAGIVGSSNVGCLVFTTGQYFGGGKNTITITSSWKTPDTVGVIDGTTTWGVSYRGANINLGQSSHKVYVILNEMDSLRILLAGKPTEKRVAWVCSTCNGQSTEAACVSSVFDSINGWLSVPRFQLGNPTFGGLDEANWLAMDSSNTSDCIALARLMQKMVTMVGCLSVGECGYVYGSSDTNCYSTNYYSPEQRVCSSHGNEIIRVKSPLGYNQWEGVFVWGGTYHAVKITKQGSAVAILREWLGLNTILGTYQTWIRPRTGDESKQIFNPGNECVTPGPWPVPKP